MIREILKDFDNDNLTETTIYVDDENGDGYLVIVDEEKGTLRLYIETKSMPPMFTVMKVSDKRVRETRYHYNIRRNIQTYSFPLNTGSTVADSVLYCDIDDERFVPTVINSFQVHDVYSESELFQLSTITHIDVEQLKVLKEFQKELESLDLKYTYVCKGFVDAIKIIKE